LILEVAFLATTTSDISLASNQVNRLDVSIRPELQAFNGAHGSRIVMLDLQIQDAKGKLLYLVLTDFQRQYDSTFADNSLHINFPVPAATEIPATEPTSSPFPLVSSTPAPPSTP